MGLEYKIERDKEFFKICQLIQKENKNISVRQAVKKAIMTPATSFFITEREFARIIRDKKNHIPKSKHKAWLYLEIRRRYRQVKANFPNMKIQTIAKNIACAPAPGFYISEERARKIYCSMPGRKTKQEQNE